MWRQVCDSLWRPRSFDACRLSADLTQLALIASTATDWFGHERSVFEHSNILACLAGGRVTLQAYVFPFTKIVID